jgi:hypothetical protein
MASAADKISIKIEPKTLHDAMLNLNEGDVIKFRQDGRLPNGLWYTEIVKKIFKPRFGISSFENNRYRV